MKGQSIKLITLFTICIAMTLSSSMVNAEPQIWQEVTVIGSREYEASLPGSGAVISTEEIRNHSYDDINSILRRVPGVYLREEDGNGLFPNISLRGADPARSQKVTLMEDGIVTAPAPYSAPEAYYSPTAGRMSSIEVLKGSSQVKYGPHTTGGVINYISTQIPTEPTAYFKTLAGSNKEFRLHGSFGNTAETPLGRIGVLVEEYYRQTDGFKSIDTTADFNGKDTGFTKTEPMVKIAWEPSDDDRYQRLEAKIGYSDLKADETYLGLAESDLEGNIYRRYSSTRFDEIDTEHSRSYLRYMRELTPDIMLSVTGYYNEFQRNWKKLHSIGGGSESNLSEALAAEGLSYSILKGEAAGTLNVRNNNREYALWGTNTNLNTQVNTGDLAHDIDFGLGYHRDYIRRQQNTESHVQNADGVITSSSSSLPGTAGNRRQNSDAFSMYVRDGIEWGKFTFTPGVRYEHVSYEYVDYDTSGADPSAVTGRAKSALDAVAGGMGINYEIISTLNAFTGVHRGYSVPGPRDNARSSIKEEVSLTGETGLRYAGQNGLTLESVYFYTDFEDLLVPDNIGGSGSGTTENAGDVISQGIELKAGYDVARHISDEFKIPTWLAFTYTNAELDGDAQSTDPESIFSGGKDGNNVPYIPDYQLAFGTGIHWKKFGFFIDATYVGETFTTASNTDNQTRPDGTPDARFGKTDEFFIFDISAHYEIKDNVKAMVNLENITDQEYIVSRHPHGPRPGQPFTVLAGLEIQF